MKSLLKIHSHRMAITGTRCLVWLVACLFSAGSMAQITCPQFDGASTLGSSHFEIGTNYNYFGATSSWGTGTLLNGLGVRTGVGAGDHFDLRVSYNRLFCESLKYGWHQVVLIPKIGKPGGRIAFAMPLGVMFEKNDYYSSESDKPKFEKMFVFSPRLVGTLARTPHFEMNATPMGEFTVEQGDWFTSIGLDVCFAASSNLDRWAFRPGLSILLPINKGSEGFIWSVGAAITCKLGSKKE